MAVANCSVPAITRSTLAAGATLYFNSTSAGWNRLTIGSNQTILTSTGSAPQWSTLAAVLAFLGTTNGSVPMCQAGTWSAFAPGASGKLLTGAGTSTVPTWGDITSAMLDTVLGSTNASVAVRTSGTWGQRVQKRVETLTGTVSSGASSFTVGAFNFTPTTLLMVMWNSTNSQFSIGYATGAGGPPPTQACGLVNNANATTMSAAVIGGLSASVRWECGALGTTTTMTQKAASGSVTWNWLAIAFE